MESSIIWIGFNLQNESKYNSRDINSWFSRYRKEYRPHYNMETVRRLTREVRIQAKYDRRDKIPEKESTELSLELCLD
jgi:hypothetical protein